MSSTSNFKMAEWNDEITDKDVTDSVGFQSRFQFELFYRDIRVFFGPRFLSWGALPIYVTVKNLV